MSNACEYRVDETSECAAPAIAAIERRSATRSAHWPPESAVVASERHSPDSDPPEAGFAPVMESVRERPRVRVNALPDDHPHPRGPTQVASACPPQSGSSTAARPSKAAATQGQSRAVSSAKRKRLVTRFADLSSSNVGTLCPAGGGMERMRLPSAPRDQPNGPACDRCRARGPADLSILR